MGSKKTGYSKGLEYDIRRFSKGTELEDNFRVFETLPFSSTNIDLNQEELFRRLDAQNELDQVSLRRFAISSFGDAVTFERNAEQDNSVYRKIHTYLKSEIEEVNRLLEMEENGKLAIVASSLGAHIISTYIWDADKSKRIFEDDPANKNNDLKNLNYLATIGCNIPLFISGLNESKIFAFDKRNDEFIWDNFYDRDDILGWPLKQISHSYQNMVTDFEINTGLYLGSHLRYWDDNDFTRPFTKRLLSLLKNSNEVA